MTVNFPYFKKYNFRLKRSAEGFPGGAVVENLPANAGDTGSILGQGTKIPNKTNKNQ